MPPAAESRRDGRSTEDLAKARGQGILCAENLRKPVDSRSDTPVGILNVTMNLGVAGTADWCGSSTEELIHEADMAFYRAK